MKCVGFHICCVDNLNKVCYCHVYRSCMWKSRMHPRDFRKHPGISGKYFTVGYCVPKMVSHNCYTSNFSPLFCLWPYVPSFTALLLNNLSKLQAITITSKHITCKSLRKEKQRYSLRPRFTFFCCFFFFFSEVSETLFFGVGDYN